MVTAAPARPAELQNAFILGYDSFIDRFTILEDDTTEAIHEFYTGMSNHLTAWSGSVTGGVRNIFRYGNQTIDENLTGNISFGSRNATRIDLRSNLHLRFFQEGSDYTFGNDYFQSNTYLKLKRAITEGTRITFKNRFETVAYEERTYFDYNYRYFDTGFELESGSYFKNLLRISGSIGFKEAPDTTDLNYRRTLTELETQLAYGASTIMSLTAQGDRRDYRGAVRRSYWHVLIYADFSYNAINGRGARLRTEAELMLFDEATAAYFDTHFLRSGLRGKLPIKTQTTLFLEPRIAWMSCPDIPEERYWEGSLVLGLDITGNENFLLSFSYEPGYRDYFEEENEIYSDYYLNRLSLISSIGLPWRTILNLFVTHDPEKHTRREDNFSITLVSVSLGKDF